MKQVHHTNCLAATTPSPTDNQDRIGKQIDKSINHHPKTKDALLGPEKAQDVTLKKLSHGNPTMKAKIEELNNGA